MDKLVDYMHDLRWVVFGLIGGGIGYLLRSDEIKARDLIIESLGAGFVGAIVSMAAKYYGMPTEATGVLVGISALIGARATLKFMKEQVLSRLKSKDSGANNGPAS